MISTIFLVCVIVFRSGSVSFGVSVVDNGIRHNLETGSRTPDNSNLPCKCISTLYLSKVAIQSLSQRVPIESSEFVVRPGKTWASRAATGNVGMSKWHCLEEYRHSPLGRPT